MLGGISIAMTIDINGKAGESRPFCFTAALIIRDVIIGFVRPTSVGSS